MLRLSNAKETIELLEKIQAADIVIIDDDKYPIRSNWKYLNLDKELAEKEDFETVFETEFHTFNWWEIKEAVKINEHEWKIGDNVVSFYILSPL
ncbi:MAG TPA: hypothetical protein VIK89_12680 [Cytophagaceae bacterium]